MLVSVTILLLSRYATGNDSILLHKRVSLLCTATLREEGYNPLR